MVGQKHTKNEKNIHETNNYNIPELIHWTETCLIAKKKQTHELSEKEDLSNVLNFCDEKKSVECNNALFYAFLM